MRGACRTDGSRHVLKTLVPIWDFSHKPIVKLLIFPSHLDGDKNKDTLSGNWHESQVGLWGWLYPALFSYFQEALGEIYFRVNFSKK